MMLVQRERAFVIQNGATKIAGAKISVSQIVKQIRVPLTRVNQRFLTGDRFLEISLRVFLVRFCEIRSWLGKPRGSDEQTKNRAEKTYPVAAWLCEAWHWA